MPIPSIPPPAPITFPRNIGASTGTTYASGDNSTLLATSAAVNASHAFVAVNVAGNSNVSLTSAQTAVGGLTLSGALTGNINVTLLTSAGNAAASGWEWTVENTTTGAYTITMIGSSGTGVAVPQGYISKISFDGTNVGLSTFPVTTGSTPSGMLVVPYSHMNKVINITGAYTYALTCGAIALVNASGATMVLSGVNLTMTWSGGNGLNAIDVGSASNSTWYYVYVVAKPDGTRGLTFSATAPTTAGAGPSFANMSGYSYWAYVGPLYISSSGVFTPFTQRGNLTWWSVNGSYRAPTVASGSATVGSTGGPSFVTLSIATAVSPLATAATVQTIALGAAITMVTGTSYLGTCSKGSDETQQNMVEAISWATSSGNEAVSTVTLFLSLPQTVYWAAFTNYTYAVNVLGFTEPF